eukprot:NODE_29_length_33183_cov_0.333666.p8 type:complete len:320 gc:universal NODE_29_length_33183_cov_0.333666:24931-23972(-)
MLWIYFVSAHSVCMTGTPSKSILFQVPSNFNLQKRSKIISTTPAVTVPPKYIIPVVWHVIHDKEYHKLDKATVVHQIMMLNKAYLETTIYFQLKKIDYINEPRMVHIECCETNTEKEFKKRHREGGKETLNIYSADSGYHKWSWNTWKGKKSSVSWSTFPDSPLDLDGVVISTERLSYKPSVLPTTLIHEIGHFFGLLHVFKGGCEDPNGDYVLDTPVVSEAARTAASGMQAASWGWQCSVSNSVAPAIKTCPNTPGNDLIGNFMDYTNCRSSFTPGQVQRIEYFRKNFRNSELTCVTTINTINLCAPVAANFIETVTI